jgi:hypothetical protein
MNIKIFRLRSGEEIISEILEEKKTSYKIQNPMVFKTNMIPGPMGGAYDMTVLNDWLVNTTTKTTPLPKNHIVNVYDANEDALKLYNLHLDSENSQKLVNTKDIIKPSSKEDKEAADLFQDFLGAILDDVAEQIVDTPIAPDLNLEDPFESEYSPKKRKRKSKRRKENISPEMEEDEAERSGIYMSMMIPGETIMNLVTAGILNPKDLVKMINETKKRNRFTGDEKDRKDFGNKYSDWNPDPKSDDYI